NQTCANRFTITRTYHAFDACGNSASCSQTIVVNDRTSPVITCPANMTISNQSMTLPLITGTATATDNCSNPTTLDFNDFTIDGFCQGSYQIQRTWIASDVCDNSAT